MAGKSRRNSNKRSNRSAARSNRGRGQLSYLSQTLLGGARPTPDQKITSEKRSTVPVVISTDAAGLAAGTVSIAAASITHGAGVLFPTLFQAYDEFFIAKATARITATRAATGKAIFWFDENDATAPTAAEIDANRHPRQLVLSNNSPKGSISMSWSPKDVGDMDWLSVASGSSTVFANLKYYTDATYYGATAVAQTVFMVEVDFLIKFRGNGTVPASAAAPAFLVPSCWMVGEKPIMVTPYTYKQMRRIAFADTMRQSIALMDKLCLQKSEEERRAETPSALTRGCPCHHA